MLIEEVAGVYMYEIADGGVLIINNFPLPFSLKSESKFKFSEC